ncbi:MAG: PCP reductase family protein [Nitrospira sp.]
MTAKRHGLFVRNVVPADWLIGIDVPVGQVDGLVDRLMWSDDAKHRLDRVPPYAAAALRELVEGFARSRRQRVITYDLIDQALTGDVVAWDADAEQRLANVPAPVRAMARIELERTAVDRGEAFGERRIDGRGQGAIFRDGGAASVIEDVRRCGGGHQVSLPDWLS